jgi:signal transduction histidine kinase
MKVMGKESRYYVVGAGLIFMISICSLMLGMTQKQGRMLETQLHDHAAALFDLIVVVRRWNSEYKGVFVAKGPGVVSNPYLVNPDIVDTHGTTYTKKNPALMTKEISKIANTSKSFLFHITSLRPVSPDNTPDAWEKVALEGFERGDVEKTGYANRNGSVFYRLMRPIYVEKSCLQCHGVHGYKVGEVRGGISVDVPFSATLIAIKRNSIIMGFLLVTLLIIFAITFYLFIWKVMDRLEKQKTLLQDLNQTKNNFIGMCAHDLRSPLASIMGFSELMLSGGMGELNENLNSSISMIEKSSMKMLNMVNSFLDISVIESGKLELQLSKGSLKSLIEEHIESCQFLADRKKIKIQTSLNATADMTFDKHRMAQVLDNIIGNAIKYSPQESTIHIMLDEMNGNVRLRVQDEGPGIPEEDRKKLFVEYRRLKSQPTGGEASTGLGLAITKKIVDYHNGKIEVESPPGKGATFIVMFPVSS